MEIIYSVTTLTVRFKNQSDDNDNSVKKKKKTFLALSFRLAVKMLQLIYAVKKHNN
jgi:hypothetical protein